MSLLRSVFRRASSVHRPFIHPLTRLVVIGCAAFAMPRALQARDLSFAQRVDAQRAIERVYYIHRTGSARRFEEAVPESILHDKVRTYLAESVALEEFWKTPVTATMLRREVARMRSGSRMPDRLAELAAALGGDEALLAETLARATLVDRLCRDFHEPDSRLPPHSWDGWRKAVATVFDPARARTVVGEPGDPGPVPGAAGRAMARGESADGRAAPADRMTPASSCDFQDLWATGKQEPIPQGRVQHSTVWTGSEMIVWGGQLPNGPVLNTGDRYDPATDTWTHTTTVGAPAPRTEHTAVWSGDRMIVWGGSSNATSVNTGGRYDPVADAWTPTTTAGAPPPARSHVAVWTGNVMVVWGGSFNGTTGGRYDPVADSWMPTSLVNVPAPRVGESVVWTGTEMIIWGGQFGNTGARYNPMTDTWTATSLVNVPTGRSGQTAVWTGSEMIVWGGFGGGFSPTGGRYNPLTDQWTATTVSGAPVMRWSHSAVWTGSRMIVWGGSPLPGQGSGDFQSGALYDPASDSWQPTSLVNVPSARDGHAAIWTGDQMIVWGGRGLITGGRYSPQTDSWTATYATRMAPFVDPGSAFVWTGAELIVWEYPDVNGGGRYDAAIDAWIPTSTTGAPQERTGATAVWTGQEMIVWGGSYATRLATGGRYQPLTDTWAAVPTVNAPSPREEHTAVWTGSEMIVWGGLGDAGWLADGGRFDPVAGQWTAIPAAGAPEARTGHTAVWTGTQMVVWGGENNLRTGGRYDPTAGGGAGGWMPTSLVGAPQGRAGHTVVWTGREMIVWGGYGAFVGSTGGRYDPVADRWTPTSLTNAPSSRWWHAAVWTGSQMIVWGGATSGSNGDASLNTGARYDPASDTWTPTSMTGVPLVRAKFLSAWTGRAMLVWGGGCYCGDVTTLIDDAAMNWYGNAVAAPPADRDGDGVSSCFDCDDANPDAWAVPGEATGLLLGADDATLSWSPPIDAGAGSLTFDLLRSDIATDFQSSAVCVASGIATPSAVDTMVPAPERVFYYAARARNACPGGVGTVGSGTSGVPRPALICP